MGPTPGTWSPRFILGLPNSSFSWTIFAIPQEKKRHSALKVPENTVFLLTTFLFVTLLGGFRYSETHSTLAFYPFFPFTLLRFLVLMPAL